ncbi:MAG: hypothetical protein ABJD13_12015 [Paracoccaceae bacterium]
MNKTKDEFENTINTIENHLAEFQPLLDDINIPENQRREFVEVLWSIMVQFVALGFGADAASQAITTHMTEAADKEPSENASLALMDAFAVSQCKNSNQDIEARKL